MLRSTVGPVGHTFALAEGFLWPRSGEHSHEAGDKETQEEDGEDLWGDGCATRFSDHPWDWNSSIRN